MIVDGSRTVSYVEIDRAAAHLAGVLLDGRADLDEARVALFLPPSAEFVVAILAVWRAGGMAVPLALSYPPPELDYVLRDADASILISRADTAGSIRPVVASLRLRHLVAPDPRVVVPTVGPLPPLSPDRRALMVYTSGTTGRPKGVVTTHANVAAQTSMLVDAWRWSPDDRTLLVLPLHHVHGLINVVGSAMWAGATCEMLPAFDAEAVWARLATGEVTVFTAVPTIYHQLIASWDAASPDQQRVRSAGCRACRLMMSGSAALPRRVLDRWREISGHVLLERYGMTEIGMALANPLAGERRPGFVGVPLPSVELRVVNEQGEPVADDVAGEVEVRGPAVFREYWRRPGATRDAFRDGWFRTGDVAVCERGAYRLLGRSSVDIIKTGGYKVSALEIEEVLRRHPAVADCAVVGVHDEEWGQRVAAAVVLKASSSGDVADLDAWIRGQLAPYKIPRAFRVVTALPRNAMGKVVKPDVAAWLEAEKG